MCVCFRIVGIGDNTCPIELELMWEVPSTQ